MHVYNIWTKKSSLDKKSQQIQNPNVEGKRLTEWIFFDKSEFGRFGARVVAKIQNRVACFCKRLTEIIRAR
jgi:hypothetical protein